jgi:sterol desaturase/sphingolipid hydroxylase (fatty acid hydroxylase superfamily)
LYSVRDSADRFRHGLKNLVLGVLNAVVIGLVFVGLWWAAAESAQFHNFGLLNWWPLPGWARLLGAFLLFDAWMYFWHRLNHRIPFLWRFHRPHHSDPRLDVTTASRFHVGELSCHRYCVFPLSPFCRLRLSELAVYEVAMFTVVQLPHANIALPAWLDRGLRVLLVTPFMHKVHHSRWEPETDSNYSSLFSFWDRLFATFRLRAQPDTLEFGLGDFNRLEDHTLIGLLTTPLKQIRRTSGQTSGRDEDPRKS